MDDLEKEPPATDFSWVEFESAYPVFKPGKFVKLAEPFLVIGSVLLVAIIICTIIL